MSKFKLLSTLILILFLVSVESWSQFDEDDDVEESQFQTTSEKDTDKGTVKDTVKDIDESSNENASDTFDEEDRKTIGRDDIKKLESAVRTNSESAMVAAASQILSQDSGNLEALNALGLYYFGAKKYGMAKILFKRALKNHPREKALHNNLGITYLAEGDLQLAIDSFNHSLAADSKYGIGGANLGSIYIKYGDYQRGLEDLARAYRAMRSDLSRGSQSALEVANNYAVALIGVGEHSTASKVFEEIDEGRFKNPQVYLNYATFLVEVRKKKNDAIRVISKLKFMTEDRSILKRVSELEKELE